MNEEKTNDMTTELTAGEILRNARTMGRRKREISTIAKQLCISEEFLDNQFLYQLKNYSFHNYS